eukprot:1388653-Pyramimonas_sp.AAC.1
MFLQPICTQRLKEETPEDFCRRRWRRVSAALQPQQTWDIDMNLRRPTWAGHLARQAALPSAPPAQLVP